MTELTKKGEGLEEVLQLLEEAKQALKKCDYSNYISYYETIMSELIENISESIKMETISE